MKGSLWSGASAIDWFSDLLRIFGGTAEQHRQQARIAKELTRFEQPIRRSTPSNPNYSDLAPGMGRGGSIERQGTCRTGNRSVPIQQRNEAVR
jgi:hypothetical protein